MMVVVFRSRLHPGVEEAYGKRVAEVFAWVQKMPGYRSIREYTSEDGERVALIEFETAEALEAWRTHEGHAKVQQEGRDTFFSQYDLQVCELVRESSFSADSR